MVIGIDIGGTKISGIVRDSPGSAQVGAGGKKVVDELTIVTPKTLFDFEKSLLKLVDFLSTNRKISGVGIGVAGLVDVQKGVVVYSPNIRFISNFCLKDFFRVNGYKNVRVSNDAKCFVLAEAVLGRGKGKETVVGITLGTGIGGGLAAQGKIYYGKNFGAGELGHMVYDGQKTFESVFKTARDKHNNQQLAKIVGALLTNIYRVVDPDLIVIGGGVALDKKRNFLESAKKICAQNLASYGIKPNNIQLSKLKNAGAIGAALLIG